LAAACLAELLRVDEAAASAAGLSGDPYSPWWSTSGWVMNDDNHHTLHLRDGERDITVVAHYRAGHFLLELPEGTVRAAARRLEGDSYRVELDGMRFTVDAVARGAEINIIDGGSLYRLTLHDPLTAGMEDEVREGSLTAPMPGQVIQVLVSPGQSVREGETLMVLTAMKMELTISAPADGVVEAVNYKVNDQVEEGQELLTIATSTEAEAAEKGDA
ncbi:biotin/lipoyl-binding protein, partial [Ectothiorhodospiraceae bacterium WFHF3C12]|nr:biotin/lipoyl-binding protein [Ectothiorhodospiraceae bacterium WFHF3C12]